MELKTCPCGNEAHLIFEDGIKVADPWSVSCKNLDCPWIFQTFTTREEAVKYWNTRHNPLESEVAELREALSNLVSFAKACNWDKYTTGRQILIRDAERALKMSER